MRRSRATGGSTPGFARANDPSPASSAVCGPRIAGSGTLKTKLAPLRSRAGVAPGWSERQCVGIGRGVRDLRALSAAKLAFDLRQQQGLLSRVMGPANTIGGGWQERKAPGALGCIEPRSVLRNTDGRVLPAIDGRLRSVGLDLSIKLTGDSSKTLASRHRRPHRPATRGMRYLRARSFVHRIARCDIAGDTSWLTYSYEYNLGTNTGDVVPRSIAYVRGPERLFSATKVVVLSVGFYRDRSRGCSAVLDRVWQSLRCRSGPVRFDGRGRLQQRVRRWLFGRGFERHNRVDPGRILPRHRPPPRPSVRAQHARSVGGRSRSICASTRRFQTYQRFSLRVAGNPINPSGNAKLYLTGSHRDRREASISHRRKPPGKGIG